VIIGDLHLVCIAVLPDKTYPPLFVDTNAVLAFTVSLQFFEPVTRWYLQILKVLCVAEQPQFPQGGLLYVCWQFPRWGTVEDLPGLFIPEGFDHALSLYRVTFNVKGYGCYRYCTWVVVRMASERGGFSHSEKLDFWGKSNFFWVSSVNSVSSSESPLSHNERVRKIALWRQNAEGQPIMLYRCDAGQSSSWILNFQFGILNPQSSIIFVNTWGIFRKCRSAVSTESPCCMAEAAIHRSLVGMGVPRSRRWSHTAAYLSEVSPSMG